MCAFEQFVVAKKGIEKKNEGGDIEALDNVDEAVVLEGDEVRVSTASLPRSPLTFSRVCGVCSQSKWTLLHYAAWKGRLALIDPLVEMGAEVDAKNKVSEDPAAAPPIDPHHHPLLPPCSIPTPTPPLAPVSPRAPSQLPLHGHQHLVDHHLALTHCLVLLYP